MRALPRGDPQKQASLHRCVCVPDIAQALRCVHVCLLLGQAKEQLPTGPAAPTSCGLPAALACGRAFQAVAWQQARAASLLQESKGTSASCASTCSLCWPCM